jgi:hypothetical protein
LTFSRWFDDDFYHPKPVDFLLSVLYLYAERYVNAVLVDKNCNEDTQQDIAANEQRKVEYFDKIRDDKLPCQFRIALGTDQEPGQYYCTSQNHYKGHQH